MSVQNNLISRAQAILKTLESEVVSSHDVLDQIELEKFFKTQDPKTGNDDLFKLFGQRSIRWLQHAYNYTRVSRTVMSMEYESPIAASVVIAKFGYGNCEVLSRVGAVRASSFCNALIIKFCEHDILKLIQTDPKCDLPIKRTVDGHMFVILGATEADYVTLQANKNYEIGKVLKVLNERVLFDPLLKIVCPVKKVVTDYPRFLQYFSLYNIRYAVKFEPLLRLSCLPQFFTDTEAEFPNAKQLVETAPLLESVLQNETFLPFLWSKLESFNAPHSIASLQDLFPNTQWKHTIRHESLVLALFGSDAETKPIADRLKNQFQLAAKRFRVKTQNNKTKETTIVAYVVELINPNPYQLRVISALSYFFTNQLEPLTKQVGGLTELIVHYAGE
jgi:hypothetical protein